MKNYFRITAVHKELNGSVIMDSNGYFEKLWQFSAELVKNGFTILDVGNEEKFLDGDLPKVENEKPRIILRASADGEPTYSTLTIDGRRYKAVTVNGKTYVPDKNV